MTSKTALWISWLMFGAFITGWAVAQQTKPDSIPGCVYNATPPTLTDRQTTTLQCDANGKLKVNTT